MIFRCSDCNALESVVNWSDVSECEPLAVLTETGIEYHDGEGPMIHVPTCIYCGGRCRVMHAMSESILNVMRPEAI
jgi:hypothetical protein